MSKAAKRLGRGIRTLISPAAPINEMPANVTPAPATQDTQITPAADIAIPPEPAITEPSVASKHNGPITVNIALITPNPHQPRKNIPLESISALATSIKTNGLLQPVTVRPVKEGRYELIAGERRWTAMKSLGWQEVPVNIRQATDQEMLELALIENIHREDLNAIERARAYREFRDRFYLNAESVAHRLGEDRTTVTNYLRLLDLPDTIQSMVAGGQISMGHARCLLGIVDADLRMKLAESVVSEQLSVRALEDIVRNEKSRKQDSTQTSQISTTIVSPHLHDMQRQFEESLKTKVRIKEGKKKGVGRITIEFYSFDDFDRVAGKLGVNLDAK